MLVAVSGDDQVPGVGVRPPDKTAGRDVVLIGHARKAFPTQGGQAQLVCVPARPVVPADSADNDDGVQVQEYLVYIVRTVVILNGQTRVNDSIDQQIKAISNG